MSFFLRSSTKGKRALSCRMFPSRGGILVAGTSGSWRSCLTLTPSPDGSFHLSAEQFWAGLDTVLLCAPVFAAVIRRKDMIYYLSANIPADKQRNDCRERRGSDA